MSGTIPSNHVPTWADPSEDGVAVIDGRERDVVDHYGHVTDIPFPGRASQVDAVLPSLNIHASRCDVVSDTDSTRMHVGPYLLTVSVGSEADSTLTSVADLEQFARTVLDAAQAVRTFLSDAAAEAQNQEINA